MAVGLEQAPGPILGVARVGGHGFAALLRDSAPDVAVARLTDHLRQTVAAVDVPGQGGSVGDWPLATPRRTPTWNGLPICWSRRTWPLPAHNPARTCPLVRFREFRMRDELVAEWEQMADIERSLVSGDFVPHYQPIVRLRDGVVVAVEALARRRQLTAPCGARQGSSRSRERVGQVARIDAAIRTAALADLRVLRRVARPAVSPGM